MSDFFSSRQSDDGWFRVGPVEVTTSVLIAALTTVGLFLYALSPELLAPLALISDGEPGSVLFGGVRQGQVWRLLSWPLANAPSAANALFIMLSIVLIWYFGSMVERELGRTRYLRYVAVLVIVPSVLYVLLVPTVVPEVVVIFGSGPLASALIVAFVAMQPTARTFFNLPFWVLVVAFEAIAVLQYVGDRWWNQLLFQFLIAGVSLVVTRSFGLSELEWIPRIPLPAFITGAPRARKAKPKAPKRKWGKGPASVTPIRGDATRNPLEQVEIDRLLDKIGRDGINSLTPEERARLDEHSRRLRGDG